MDGIILLGAVSLVLSGFAGTAVGSSSDHGAPAIPKNAAPDTRAECTVKNSPWLARPHLNNGSANGHEFTGASGIALMSEVRYGAAAVAQTCGRIAKKLASVGYEECLKRDLTTTGYVSVIKTPILIKEYPPLPARTPRARVLLIGGIHGDEYASVSVVFKWMKILDKHHSGLFHWRIAPLMNPDGLLRKRSQRMNANGVDLNRNLPTPDWHRESNHYWVTKTGRNPRRYPGQAPASEPESQWLLNEIECFRPDAIISVHAPYGIVDFDGPPEGPGTLGSLTQKYVGTYPGSLGNFAGVQRQLPVVTIELSSAVSMPPRREIRDVWVDLVRWLVKRFPKQSAADSR